MEAEAIDLGEARVLVVEDNEINRIFACAVLESMGLTRVECACNGREGLDKVESFAPDIVLLDLMMPVMNGEEFLRALRADPRHRSLPVLVLSAVVDQTIRNALFAAGANDYIGKPIDRLELVARVEVHLRNHLMLADLRSYRDRLAMDLRTAQSMQNALLPTPARMAEMKEQYGIAIDAAFKPSAELGGDLWGLAPVDDHRVALFTVDFSGHGVAASINTFRMHLLLKDLESQMGDPAVVMAWINRTMAELLPRGQFATMTLVEIDVRTRSLSMVNAGGPPPILVEPGHPPRMLTSAGLPLGISASATYEVSDIPFPVGSHLSLYSDALTDASDSGGAILGEAWMLDLLTREPPADVSATLARVMKEFAFRSPGEFKDDVTWVQIAG